MTDARLPVIRLSAVDALHADFVQMFRRYGTVELDGSLCRRIAVNVQAALDDEHIDVDVVFQTLAQYLGRMLDQRWTELLARQIAARYGELRLGVLSVYERTVREEWVPVEIYDVKPCVWQGQPTGQALVIYCLAGHPAGHRLTKRLPEKYLGYVASQIGFTRRLTYDQEPRQLIGLRIWGRLVPSKARDDLEITEWKIDKEMTRWNRRIIKRRARFDVDMNQIRESEVDDYSCPFDEECYCLECSRRLHDCFAVPNRERSYEPPVVRPPPNHHQPQGSGRSPSDSGSAAQCSTRTPYSEGSTTGSS